MIEHTEKLRDLFKASAQIAPVTIYAITLNQAVGIATFVYFVLQSAFLIWRWRREAKKKG